MADFDATKGAARPARAGIADGVAGFLTDKCFTRGAAEVLKGDETGIGVGAGAPVAEGFP